MKKVELKHMVIMTLFVDPAISSMASGQEVPPAPTLFIGRGTLPEKIFKVILKLTDPNAKLVVAPSASNSDIDGSPVGLT